MSNLKLYSPAEERLNIASHVLGLILSVIGLFFLIPTAWESQSVAKLSGAIIFGLSLVILYTASSVYHGATDPQKREKLRVFDHVSIFILIAGTYTPFTLVTLADASGWVLFGVVWALAVLGITLKLFFTGRFKLASTATYLIMGWLIVFAADDLIQALPSEGFVWLAAGGGAYTIGAVLYMIKKLPFNHAIFHLLVLIGSACHFIAIHNYVVAEN